MQTRFALCLVILCAGCAGINRAMVYNDVDPVSYEDEAGGWRIFDHPAQGKMMVTPSFGRAIASGAVRGATLGIANDDPIYAQYKTAAKGWLNEQGRTCEILEAYSILGSQWEVAYRC